MKRIAFALAIFVGACGSGIFDDPNRVSDTGNGACGPESCEGRCGDIQDACGNRIACARCASPADGGSDSSSLENSACEGQPAGWVNELADAPGDTGRYPSLGVDAAGTVHVSYYDGSGTIRYARRVTSGTWTLESIDTVGILADAGDVGMGTSLALDDAGSATVAYYDLTNRDLKIARARVEGGWALETADAPGDVGGWPSVVVDDAGTHVTYYDRTSKTLKGADRNPQGAWTYATIDTLPTGWQSSLAKDTSGGLHVTYSEQQAYLSYAYRPRNGQWQPNRVEGTSQGLWSSLAVDALGGLHVTHCSKYGNGDLLYGTRPGPTTWTTTPIESATNMSIGWSSALGLDPRGAAHVVYIHQSSSELRYARQTAGSWDIATLDAPGTPFDLGRYVALSIDRHGAVHVAYYDARTGDLRYARRCP